METGAIAQIWSQTRTSGLDWAWDAYQKFRQELSPWSQSRFATSGQGKEVFTVVFGKTQSGKTTLILTLLGIAEDHMVTVSKLLRGGREDGESATATAMRYQRSPNENWHFSDASNDSELNDNGICHALAKLRGQMENSEVDDGIVAISIPSRYFNPLPPDQPSIRILDLPGDKPKDCAEAAHVRRIAEKYLPDADLILMVCRADDLASLNPRATPLPGIGDWRHTPGRFRVITSSSFSIQSNLDWSKAQESLTKEAVRLALREQIATFDFDLPDECLASELYFPLEFGDTWAKQKEEKDDALYRKANPLIKSLMGDLREAIVAAAQPANQLRRALEADRIIGGVKIEELKSWKQRKEKLQRAQKKAETNLNGSRKVVANAEQAVGDLPQNGWPDAYADYVRAAACPDLDKLDTDIPRPEVADFRKKRDIFLDELLAQTLQVPDELEDDSQDNNSDQYHCRFKELQAILNLASRQLEQARPTLRDRTREIFSPLTARLDSYVTETYFPKIFSDYQRDCELFRACAAGAREVVAKAMQSVCEDAMKLRGKFWHDRRRKAERGLARMLEAERIFYRAHTAATEACELHELYFQEFERKMQQDMERSHLFRKSLDEAWKAELAIQRQRINAETRPARRLMRLLGAVSVCDQAQRFLKP